LGNKFDETISARLGEGIGSVVLAYETANQGCSGEIGITGAFAAPGSPNTPPAFPNMEVYTQDGYYQEPYIFELGWNLGERGLGDYPVKAGLSPASLGAITVSFNNEYGAYAKDEAALQALAALLERLGGGAYPPIKTPFVVSVKDIGGQDIAGLAEEYYINDELTSFSAVFPALGMDVKKEYCDKMLEDGKIAFFSASIKNMGSSLINACAENAYQTERVSFFSVIAPHLSETARLYWVERAAVDERNAFLNVLTK
jgi:hypothetical protein